MGREVAQKAREHHLKHGVYPRINGERQTPSFWDKMVRSYKVMSGVDVSGESAQFMKDNPDLVNGVKLTVDVAAIPIKSLRLASDSISAGDVVTNLVSGDYSKAAIGAISIVGGEGTSHFMKNFIGNDQVLRAVGTGVQKSTSGVLTKDCYSCE